MTLGRPISSACPTSPPGGGKEGMMDGSRMMSIAGSEGARGGLGMWYIALVLLGAGARTGNDDMAGGWRYLWWLLQKNQTVVAGGIT